MEQQDVGQAYRLWSVMSREHSFFRNHSATSPQPRQDAIEKRKVRAKSLLYMVSKAIR